MIIITIADVVLLSEKRGIREIDVDRDGDLGRMIDLVSNIETTGVVFHSKDDRIYFMNRNNGDIMTVFRNNSGKSR